MIQVGCKRFASSTGRPVVLSARASPPGTTMTLMRSVAILALLVLQIGIVGCRRPIAHDAPPTLEDATRLDKLVEQLYGKASFREAVPRAMQSLALHEKLQGATHLDVATSLRTLA